MEVESNATRELNKLKDAVLVTKSYVKIEHIITGDVRRHIMDEAALDSQVDQLMMQKLAHQTIKNIEIKKEPHRDGEKRTLEVIVFDKDLFHTMMQSYLNTMPRQMVKELLQGGRNNTNPIKEYTEEKSFWERLQSFVKDVDTGMGIGDNSAGEKEMILNQCKEKLS